MYHYFRRQSGATKGRTLTIFAAIVVTISVIIIAYSFKKKDVLEQKQSTTSSVPTGITNVPGERTSEKYQALQLEENRLQAQNAKKQGVSAIPTLTSNLRAEITPITENKTCSGCCCTGDTFNPNDTQAALGLAANDLEAFKRLMLENPTLAQKLARENPELFKQLMRDDPNFANNFAANNPNALSALLGTDPDFSRSLADRNPDMMKKLLLNDPNLPDRLAEKNGDLLRKLMKTDPAFSKKFAKNNTALAGELKREAVPILDPAVAARLIGEIQKNPGNSLELLKANPGLANALSAQDLSLLDKDAAHSKLFLTENPSLAASLAKNDPAALKRLMLTDPKLAAKLAHDDPASFKALTAGDSAFMNAMSTSNPDLSKEFIKDDVAFAKKMASINPDFIKQSALSDAAFASALQAQNPDLLKDFMKNDLGFSKQMAETNPGVVKALLADPQFADDLSKRNPNSLKSLIAGDPLFTRNMIANNPETFKSLLKLDPDFAKLMNLRNSDALKNIFEQDPQFAKEFTTNNPNLRVAGVNPAALAAVSPLGRAAQATDYQKMRDDRALQDKQKQMDEAYKKGLDELTGNMQTQLGNATKIWSEASVLSYTAGKWAEPPKARERGGSPAGGAGGSSSEAMFKGPVLAKAGSIVFAVMDTAINSDEPGPILATIVSGRLKGGKVLGELKSSGPKAEKLTLNFSTMNLDAYPDTFSIKAVAVDPETSRTALATDVDHHYLLRYGTLLASSFMTGYSKIITNEGTVNTTATNGGTTTTTSPQLSGKREILAALGDVGKAIGTAFADNVSRANTITIDAGTSIGLLFLGDVNEPQ
jgi:type F conjugative transfer system protein TrbI